MAYAVIIKEHERGLFTAKQSMTHVRAFQLSSGDEEPRLSKSLKLSHTFLFFLETYVCFHHFNEAK